MLVLVEHAEGGVDELSLQALTLARELAGGEPVAALLVRRRARERPRPVWAPTGCRAPTSREDDRLAAYAPGAWARCLTDAIDRVGPSAVVAAGSNRGNEVLAHVATRLGQTFAANCTELRSHDPLTVVRVRWGGTLLEEARVHGELPLLSVAPHTVAATSANGAGAPAVEPLEPALDDADLAVRVSEHVETVTSGVSLAEAKVVVSGGRGVGSADGFAMLEELAELLEAAVGCSRVVTSAGWRPAHRPGGADRHEGLPRPLHRVRHQRRHPAHRRLQGRQEDPRDQHGRRGADPDERRLRGDRRSRRGRARDHRRAAKGAFGVVPEVHS